MLKKIDFKLHRWPLSAAVILLWSLTATASAEDAAAISADNVMPAEEEPLHVVRYQSDQFLIYTNWVESGVKTEYHKHAHDQLAVIPVQTSVTGQKPGEAPERLDISPGSVAFFPYADGPEPYVHRVGATAGTTFVNVGLEFRLPLSAACHGTEPLWTGLGVEPLKTNRRGQPYRVTLLPDQRLELPADGRALLLVPVGDAELTTDAETWSNKLGGFRFYQGVRPKALGNPGLKAVTVVVFKAC